MSKTFRYFRKTGEVIDRLGEWDGDEGYNFDYTPDDSDFSHAIVEVVTDYYFGDIIKNCPDIEKELKNKVSNLISEMDFEDDLAEAFEDELKEYFEDEAQESEKNY